MKVFQLNTYCGVKSTGKIAYDIACLVEKDGGKSRIGYGVPGISKESERFAYKIGNPLSRKIHAVIRKLLDAEGYGSIIATCKLIRELKGFKPDVVQLHNIHGCYLNLRILFSQLVKMQVPVVWTLHDCWPFTGHCAYFDACGCSKWVHGCYGCEQLDKYPVCVGIDGSARNWNHKKKVFCSLQNLHFVVPCEWLGEKLQYSMLSKYPVHVIPNGVDRAVFHPIDYMPSMDERLRGKYILLAAASEWDERKGLNYIIQASRELEDKYVFVVLGLSSDQIASLPQGIIGMERTESVQELAEWYSIADCFVNPTLEDNMPMVNLEAMACGTPVVAFDTGGCREAVGDTAGRIVPQRDVNALCNAIRDVCGKKAVMRGACLERASMFDSKVNFSKYISLYKELIG